MQGRIVKGIAGFYYVNTEVGILECKARGIFRKNKITPMVGDQVTVIPSPEGNVIDEIHERSSELVRPFVANVSQAFVVFALRDPQINWDLLNKFLVSLERSHIHPLLIFNKKDLSTEAERQVLLERFLGTGYGLYFIEAREKQDMELLLELLKGGVTVLCGPSGAGKSTLLNQLAGVEKMETGIISKKNSTGKHTTRHSELIEVNGAYLVDTPGFSNMDFTMEARELKECFPEFEQFQGECRFQGCNHDKEPGCKIKEAVGQDISKERYDFYVKYYNELIEENKRKW